MRSLFLAPHNDDETLFGAFTIMRYAPTVAVVFKSDKQRAHGIEADTREFETTLALDMLGAGSWEQWPIRDSVSDAEARIALRSILETLRTTYEHVFAPAPDELGHEQHTLVGEVALEVFGEDRVTLYLTYRRGEGATRSEWPAPFEPGWVSAKLLALGAYASQIEHPPTAPWFIDLIPIREFYAHEPKIVMRVETDDGDVMSFMRDHETRLQKFGILRRFL